MSELDVHVSPGLILGFILHSSLYFGSCICRHYSVLHLKARHYPSLLMTIKIYLDSPSISTHFFSLTRIFKSLQNLLKIFGRSKGVKLEAFGLNPILYVLLSIFLCSFPVSRIPGPKLQILWLYVGLYCPFLSTPQHTEDPVAPKIHVGWIVEQKL